MMNSFEWTEVACLNAMTDATWVSSHSVRIIEQALAKGRDQVAARVLTNHAKELRWLFSKISPRFVKKLIESGDLRSLCQMIRAHSQDMNLTVRQIMASYAHLSLIEIAVHFERLSVLEWLVIECQMNRFQNISTPVMELLHDVANLDIRDRMH